MLKQILQRLFIKLIIQHMSFRVDGVIYFWFFFLVQVFYLLTWFCLYLILIIMRPPHHHLPLLAPDSDVTLVYICIFFKKNSFLFLFRVYFLYIFLKGPMGRQLRLHWSCNFLFLMS